MMKQKTEKNSINWLSSKGICVLGVNFLLVLSASAQFDYEIESNTIEADAITPALDPALELDIDQDIDVEDGYAEEIKPRRSDERSARSERIRNSQLLSSDGEYYNGRLDSGSDIDIEIENLQKQQDELDYLEDPRKSSAAYRQRRAQRLKKRRVEREAESEAILSESLEEMRLKEERKRIKALMEATKELQNKNARQKRDLIEKEREIELMNAREEALLRQQQELARQKELDRREQELQQREVIQTQHSAIKSETSADSGVMNQTSIFPLIGYPFAIGTDNVDVQGQFAAGAGVNYDITDTFAIEVSYTYLSYYLEDTSGQFSNSYTYSNNSCPSCGGYYGNNAGYYLDEFDMQQHQVEGLMKYKLFTKSSSFRPFIGAGLNYTMTNVARTSGGADTSGYGGYYGGNNYNQYSYQPEEDEGSAGSFGASVAGGMDYGFTQSLSVGARLKYTKLFNPSYEESYYGNYSVGYAQNFQAVDALADQLADQSFFQILGVIRYSF